MHQKPFMEGGLLVGSLPIVPLAEFVMCVIVTTVLIWIFSP